MPDSPTKRMAPGHVPGLYLICAVELYEQLAGVMVFSLLVLYLNECLGLGAGLAAKVASYIQMLSYAAGVLGGGLADRGLGARRAAFWGSVLLWLGYSALGSLARTSSALWVAGALVIAGHGLFKPNCTALVGALYARSDSRRSSAFVWFYYAINVGSMLGPCIGGLVRTSVGWIVAFRVAAISISVSSVLLALGRRYLTDDAAAPMLPPEGNCTTAPITASHPTAASRAGALVLVLAVLAVASAVQRRSSAGGTPGGAGGSSACRDAGAVSEQEPDAGIVLPRSCAGLLARRRGQRPVASVVACTILRGARAGLRPGSGVYPVAGAAVCSSDHGQVVSSPRPVDSSRQ